ncbi:MAG: phenylacetic acid degradation operon negative regulatory protein PaaX [Chloroflexi bacterium]|nr:phenylacetic acid degradation operon negative regulatory protein PaaX [Chloroflexota bacterium]
MASLRSQGMVLTLYGDYIRQRGGEIWVGNLIKLLGNFGLSELAIRSALSRMCRKGLLSSRHEGRRSFFSLTPQGDELLVKGTQRIFQRPQRDWDGSWHIVVYSIPEERREVRDHFRQELSWMGFGALTNACWICPWDHSQEVQDLARALEMCQHVEIFAAQHMGFATSRELVTRCWDLERIHRRYVDFLEKYGPQFQDDASQWKAGYPLTPAQCFVKRFMLIHEYRRIPYFDPDLPREFLPSVWLRNQSAQVFTEYHNLLAPRANQYFDSIFKKTSEEKKAVAV